MSRRIRTFFSLGFSPKDDALQNCDPTWSALPASELAHYAAMSGQSADIIDTIVTSVGTANRLLGSRQSQLPTEHFLASILALHILTLSLSHSHIPHTVSVITPHPQYYRPFVRM